MDFGRRDDFRVEDVGRIVHFFSFFRGGLEYDVISLDFIASSCDKIGGRSWTEGEEVGRREYGTVFER